MIKEKMGDKGVNVAIYKYSDQNKVVHYINCICRKVVYHVHCICNNIVQSRGKSICAYHMRKNDSEIVTTCIPYTMEKLFN